MTWTMLGAVERWGEGSGFEGIGQPSTSAGSASMDSADWIENMWRKEIVSALNTHRLSPYHHSANNTV